MFQGTTLCFLDEKGRLSLPKRHREVFSLQNESTLVLTRHPDGCLVLYPQAIWQERRAQLMALPYSARAFVRFVLGSAVEVSLDKAGRVLIPASLRQFVGLTHEVMLVGLGSHLELWDSTRYAQVEQEALNAGIEAGSFTF